MQPTAVPEQTQNNVLFLFRSHDMSRHPQPHYDARELNCRRAGRQSAA
jgi:hypothetical protein